MFPGEQKMDEVFISKVYSESVLGNHFVEVEKQRMPERHAIIISNATTSPILKFIRPLHLPRFTN